ncbi:MAG: hypothetical protein OXI01_15120 [Albidovulum sp.]|nr:hypothetical protein [Albidovulum sp.]
MEDGIRPNDASVLILDQEMGATLCFPAIMIQIAEALGIASDADLTSADAGNETAWMTIGEEGREPKLSCGRLLHYFATGLQLRLGSWYDEYGDHAGTVPNWGRC